MQLTRLLAILAISLTGHGCSLVSAGTSSTVGEARIALTHHQLHHRARQQAEAAWTEFAASSQGASYSKDYERGFKDGFVRTVWWGPEEAPIIPPSGYWAAQYQGTTGHQAIADWAEGFRRGVSVALQTGASMSLKLPSPGPDLDVGTIPVIQTKAPLPTADADAVRPGNETEVLPAPRPVPAPPPGEGENPVKSRGKSETVPLTPYALDLGPARDRSPRTPGWVPASADAGKTSPPSSRPGEVRPNKKTEVPPSPVPLVQLGRPQ
ncbi:MAG: hypothetical protein K2R98_24765 [Gemmataceae bacterium]|nr:hypothetical protein [Gemmataceae bacterium]